MTHRSSRAAGALVAAAAALFTAAPAFAGPAGPIRATHAWVRPTPPGAPTAAGYVTLTNTGPRPDRLIGGSSPRAASVEVHAMSMAGGVMRMRPVMGGVDLPAGKAVSLDPGGLHLMLVAPKGPVVRGQRIPVTLRFAHARPLTLDFAVEQGAPSGMEMR